MSSYRLYYHLNVAMFVFSQIFLLLVSFMTPCHPLILSLFWASQKKMKQLQIVYLYNVLLLTMMQFNTEMLVVFKNKNVLHKKHHSSWYSLANHLSHVTILLSLSTVIYHRQCLNRRLYFKNESFYVITNSSAYF